MSDSALDKVQYEISDFEVFTAADGIPSIRPRAPRPLPDVAQAVLDVLGYDDLVDEVENLRTTVEQDLIYQRDLEARLTAVMALHRPVVYPGQDIEACSECAEDWPCPTVSAIQVPVDPRGEA
jgi:hypothetical protein